MSVQTLQLKINRKCFKSPKVAEIPVWQSTKHTLPDFC